METEVLLLDLWPVATPLLIVFNPETAAQVTSTFNLPKDRNNSGEAMKPIIGGPSMLSMNGEEWKLWRNLFNPGFSAASMTEYIPHIVDCVQVFCEKLEENSGKGIFLLEELTTRLTTNVIVKVTLDADLNYQRADHLLPHAFDTITRWHSMWNPLIRANPLRPLIQTYYGNVIEKFVRKELERRFSELKSEESFSSQQHRKAKSVIALALEAYIATSDSRNTIQENLDEHFARYASYQIRLFLFAGNDTTSSTIVYVYYILSRHPEVVNKLRGEHDNIFGADTGKTAEMLKEKPALLNQCRYTMAVIKETLRLYAPAGTIRTGVPGVILRDRHNNRIPMDGLNTTILHAAVHTNPRIWPRPNDFLPERFLVEPGHKLYPDPAAYRPFEQGPRNCIGQTLVYNEMRIVLVLTARRFVMKPAYEEWDTIQAGNDGVLRKIGKALGAVSSEPQAVNGDRAYQTDTAGVHPKDGYPCRVELL